jgi:transcriptional antiterminator RfaH
MAWTTESLFANYLFARFDRAKFLRRVQSARGVRAVVHFGSSWPVVPESAITELRELIGHEELHVIRNPLRPGDSVEIATGPFHRLLAVVNRVMPSRDRVAILLDFLGRQTELELQANHLVLVEQRPPAGVFAI